MIVTLILTGGREQATACRLDEFSLGMNGVGGRAEVALFFLLDGWK
jgi:hypothetical protein